MSKALAFLSRTLKKSLDKHFAEKLEEIKDIETCPHVESGSFPISIRLATAQDFNTHHSGLWPGDPKIDRKVYDNAGFRSRELLHKIYILGGTGWLATDKNFYWHPQTDFRPLTAEYVFRLADTYDNTQGIFVTGKPIPGTNCRLCLRGIAARS